MSLTNGNADLQRVGLHGHFSHHVAAREVGVAKPDPAIFHHACARLGLAPSQVLHVGDDPLLDVQGRAPPACARPGSIVAAIPGPAAKRPI